MKIKPINADVMKELMRIQASIPQEWFEGLTYKAIPKENQYLIDKFKDILKKGKITQEQERKINIILDSKKLEVEREYEDKAKMRRIDDYIDEQLELSRRLGKIPAGKKHRNINKKLKKMIYGTAN